MSNPPPAVPAPDTAGSPADPYRVARLRGAGESVFAEMSALATLTGSINLGQGFPDTPGPPEVLTAAIDAIRQGINQYPPGLGLAALREAIATHQARFYDLIVDPDTEVLVTAGATEALAATILALCAPGEEVVCFEPYYDAYPALIELSGGRMVTVPLDPPGWGFDPDRLDAAIGPRTRLVLVNTPHNRAAASSTTPSYVPSPMFADERMCWR